METDSVAYTKLRCNRNEVSSAGHEDWTMLQDVFLTMKTTNLSLRDRATRAKTVVA